MEKKYSVLRLNAKAKDLLQELALIKELPMTTVMRDLIKAEYKKIKGE